MCPEVPAIDAAAVSRVLGRDLTQESDVLARDEPAIWLSPGHAEAAAAIGQST